MHSLQNASLKLKVSKTTLYKYLDKYNIQITKQKNLSFLSEHEYTRLVNYLTRDGFYSENNMQQYNSGTGTVQLPFDQRGAEESPNSIDREIIEQIKKEISDEFDPIILKIKTEYEHQLEVSNEEIRKKNAEIEQKQLAIAQHMETAQKFAIKVKETENEKIDIQTKYDKAIKKYYNIKMYFVIAMLLIVLLIAFIVLSSQGFITVGK